MKGLNKVLLLGNLGKDPEVQTLEGNIKVAKFTLATTEGYKDENGQVHSQTEWHNIVLWRGLAYSAQTIPPILHQTIPPERACQRACKNRLRIG